MNRQRKRYLLNDGLRLNKHGAGISQLRGKQKPYYLPDSEVWQEFTDGRLEYCRKHHPDTTNHNPRADSNPEWPYH